MIEKFTTARPFYEGECDGLCAPAEIPRREKGGEARNSSARFDRAARDARGREEARLKER